MEERTNTIAKTESEDYIKGYNDGRKLSEEDVKNGLIGLVALIVLVVIFTRLWIGNVSTSSYSAMTVDQMIHHYEVSNGKTLSEWRKGQIRNKTNALSGDEAWSVVKTIGDEI